MHYFFKQIDNLYLWYSGVIVRSLNNCTTEVIAPFWCQLVQFYTIIVWIVGSQMIANEIKPLEKIKRITRALAWVITFFLTSDQALVNFTTILMSLALA